jgi:hypothetical protein
MNNGLTDNFDIPNLNIKKLINYLIICIYLFLSLSYFLQYIHIVSKKKNSIYPFQNTHKGKNQIKFDDNFLCSNIIFLIIKKVD